VFRVEETDLHTASDEDGYPVVFGSSTHNVGACSSCPLSACLKDQCIASLCFFFFFSRLLSSVGLAQNRKLTPSLWQVVRHDGCECVVYVGLSGSGHMNATNPNEPITLL
jgi:hypothetical protein